MGHGAGVAFEVLDRCDGHMTLFKLADCLKCLVYAFLLIAGSRSFCGNPLPRKVNSKLP